MAYKIRYDETCNVYVSYCKEYDLYSQGTTYDNAVMAIEDAVESYIIVRNKYGF